MKTQTIGNFTVDLVAEIAHLPQDAGWLLPNTTPDMIARYASLLGPDLIRDGMLMMSYHSFVIRTPNRTILVDTCNGNHKKRTSADFNMLASDTYLKNLAAIGLKPEDIDVVLCTHLHADHVGWNTQLIDGRWVPTFPNAKYVMSRNEFDFYVELQKQDPSKRVNHGAFDDSVLPVVEVGMAELVSDDHSLETYLDDNIWLSPTPGHTPHHVCVHARSKGSEGVIGGDAIHHPIQFYERQLYCVGDRDPDMARKTRDKLIDEMCDSGKLLLPCHFPAPTAGWIHSTPEGPRFKFVDG
jgi:glyoxylase-like metal-dependent hydrolase (beta-lactamase superfamily II)